jgi:hypothetical protein
MLLLLLIGLKLPKNPSSKNMLDLNLYRLQITIIYNNNNSNNNSNNSNNNSNNSNN